MKQTAMQDLRQDLLDTIVTGSDALNEIEDEQIRNGAKTLFQTTINTIISRIDEELLEMEKQHIIDAYDDGNPNGFIDKDGEQYYNETFNN
jgi:hypothetical protein